MSIAVIILTPNGYKAVRKPDNWEIISWTKERTDVVCKIKVGDKSYRAVHYSKTQVHIGYLDSGISSSNYSKYSKTELNKFLLPIDDLEQAQSGDQIIGRYIAYSNTGECRYTLWWTYNGSLTPPFKTPLELGSDGEPVSGSNYGLYNGGDKECSSFAPIAKAFYDLHAGNIINGDIIDKNIVAEIAQVLTEILEDEELTELFTSLNSFPNVYAKQKEYWEFDSENIYVEYNNVEFKQYLDFLKGIRLQYKNIKAEIKESIEKNNKSPEAMAQLGRIINSEVLALLTVEERIEMLRVIADGKMREYGDVVTQIVDGIKKVEINSGEEHIALKIVKSFLKDVTANAENNTKFLHGLRQKGFEGNENQSLYQTLYKNIDNSCLFGMYGNNLKQVFVYSIYTIWVNSNYNPFRLENDQTYFNNSIDQWENDFNKPYQNSERTDEVAIFDQYRIVINRPFMLDYKSTVHAGYFCDDFEFIFDSNGSGIIYNKTSTGTYSTEPSLPYDFFQPVSLVTATQETAIPLPLIRHKYGDVNTTDNLIPIFLLKYIDDVGDDEDKLTTLGYVLDAVSLVAGLGAFAGIRRISKLGQALIAITASLEISTASINIWLRFSGCDTDFCKNLQAMVTWLEIFSLTADGYASLMAKKSAKKALNTLENYQKPSYYDEIANTEPQLADDSFNEIKLVANDLVNPELFAYVSNKVKTLSTLGENSELYKWITHVDNAENQILIENLKYLEDLDIKNGTDYLKQLDVDFNYIKTGETIPKYADDFKELFAESPDDIISKWLEIKKDPAYYKNKFDNDELIDSRWQTWAKREFFKDYIKWGNKFERETVKKAFENSSSFGYQKLKTLVKNRFSKNIDNYKVIRQVQLYYDGDKYFVADFVFVKYKGFGVIEDIVVVESKLSRGTDLTTAQKAAALKDTYWVRSKEIDELDQGDMLKFEEKNIKWFKVFDGVDNDITDISQAANRIKDIIEVEVK